MMSPVAIFVRQAIVLTVLLVTDGASRSVAQSSQPERAEALPTDSKESSSSGGSTASVDQVTAKAEAGDAAAECDLGLRYMRGNGVAKDYVQGVKWFRKAAQQNYAEGQRYLGIAYTEGIGVQKDYDQAFAWLDKAAKQGDIQAQARLGVCYSFGHGVARNDGEAVTWYRKAAELNDAIAQNNLGNSCMEGRGVTKDVVQGYKWILLAAAQGLPIAKQNLAKFENNLTPSQLAEARGLADAFRAADLSGSETTLQPLPTPSRTQSIVESKTSPTPSRSSTENLLGIEPLPTVPPVRTLLPSPSDNSVKGRAEAGDVEAALELGLAYVNGSGVAKNFAEGAKWLSKAAEQNNALAQYNLAVCYAKGLGKRKNLAQACQWFLKAAQQNNPEAQYNLGFYYLNGGVGVRRDYVQAYKWIALAAAQGDRDAQSNLAFLEERMTRNAIAQGQALVREFAPAEGVASGGGIPSEGGSSQSQNGPLQPHNTGTGFFVTDDGYLITNFHVVKEGAEVRLVTRHGNISARVVRVDSSNDLALLKAEGVFAALPVGSSVGVKLGDSVSTVGFPYPDLQGVTPKFTRGEVNSLAGMKDDARFFQISTQIQPGNSGGALVDEHGNVVGVTSSGLDDSDVFKKTGHVPENVNYAIKSNFVLNFLRSSLETSDKLKTPATDQDKPADLIDRMQDSAALVVVYWHAAK